MTIKLIHDGKKLATLETIHWSVHGTHLALLSVVGRAEYKRLMRAIKLGETISHTYGETNRGGYVRTVTDFTGGYRLEGSWGRDIG